MDWKCWIERKPGVLGGKPVAKGTRIAIESILERLGDGWSEQQLLDSWPQLRIDHIRAAQSYAAASIAGDEIIELPTQTP